MSDVTMRIFDIDYVKNHLFVKAVNRSKIRESEAFKEAVGDICLLLIVSLDENDEFAVSGRVSQKLLEFYAEDDAFGNDISKVWDLAFENISKLNRPSFMNPLDIDYEKILFDTSEIPRKAIDDATKDDISEDAPYYILTNKKGVNGAASIFVPGVADRLSELINDDLYIAFTSVHEAMIHPKAKEVDVKLIKDSVVSTNKFTESQEEDVLSDYIYEFNRSDKTFKVVM